ncbi:hypothetical protein Pla22_41110 [Rubripirellula amarantea]|uniref:Uncharacterized protein n=1 Tax=Rubripirellula amarantea TaxID=2527999 RepID=A0A5C5WKN2_9BACT|nr:NfeD family protein [Rubripirellula amarantea]TWT51334.1 hypothetical protein Pla22_41110 [Rubripirellula amarantea]
MLMDSPPRSAPRFRYVRRGVPTQAARTAYSTILMLAAVFFAAMQLRLQAQDQEVKNGFLVDVPVPLTTQQASDLVSRLERLNDDAGEDQRRTVVFRYGSEDVEGSRISDASSVDETAFEDALRLARAITGPKLRRLKIVSWVTSEVSGHSTLPIIASDMLLMGERGVIASANSLDASGEETIMLSYLSIGNRRELFPDAMIKSLLDPDLELAWATKVGGEKLFVSGESLEQLRQEGSLLDEEVWSQRGESLRLDASKLRKARIAASVTDSEDEVAQLLDLATLRKQNESVFEGESKAVLLEITGSIASNRSQRWRSNLAHSLKTPGVNTWLISIDSIGGSLDISATMASLFSDPKPPLRTVAGFVRGEARGDSALIALSCKPLYLKPDSRLGGPGAETMSMDRANVYDELIEQVADSVNRPAALIRGLLDPTLDVYRYTNQKTGRIRFATEADIADELADGRVGDGNDNPRGPADSVWQRGEKIELGEGISASEAVTLGLAEGEAESLAAASDKLGLSEIPQPVADRGLVRLVERLGRSTGLSILLLFIGFSALSTEMNSPGLSFPGFIALICFAMFFWMKFLAGTAEWFELLALSLGLICIGIEIFVLPGFGVFGVGGLALTVLGIVLMSQTFVVPTNTYQITLLSKGIWSALAGAAGMVGGFLVMRMLFPHIPLFKHLVMEAPDGDRLDASERLADYSYLVGRQGFTTTPLRPSGKAQFDDEIVQVMSDGGLIEAGALVRVSDVHANRVVVELVERTDP